MYKTKEASNRLNDDRTKTEIARRNKEIKSDGEGRSEEEEKAKDKKERERDGK